jgi:hypothetical protein
MIAQGSLSKNDKEKNDKEIELITSHRLQSSDLFAGIDRTPASAAKIPPDTAIVVQKSLKSRAKRRFRFSLDPFQSSIDQDERAIIKKPPHPGGNIKSDRP